MTTQGGDAMDLDAVGRKRFSRLPNEEFQRRRKEGLCFRCGKKGHAAKDCKVKQVKIREIGTWRQEEADTDDIEHGGKREETLNNESLSE